MLSIHAYSKNNMNWRTKMIIKIDLEKSKQKNTGSIVWITAKPYIIDNKKENPVQVNLIGGTKQDIEKLKKNGFCVAE
jgi:hypothetical protein